MKKPCDRCVCVCVCVCVCARVCVCVCRRQKEKGGSKLWQCCSAVSPTLVSRITTGEKVVPDYRYKDLLMYTPTHTHTHTRTDSHKGRGRQELHHTFTCSFPKFHKAAAISNLQGFTSKQPLEKGVGGWFGGYKTLRVNPSQFYSKHLRLHPPASQKKPLFPSSVGLNIHEP